MSEQVGENIDFVKLEGIAREIRRHVIRMTAAAGSGHPGGSLSVVELLVAFYFSVLRHNPSDPLWPDRDRLILSKGHGCPALYAALAEAGYLDREILTTLRKLGSPLQGHPDKRFLPVLEASTGSLGQGLSIGIGMALAARLDRLAYRTYVILGDGEIDEGQVWEAAAYASFHKLQNLVAVVDYNKYQLDGPVKQILDMEPILDKWRAFGWDAIEIDGHDLRQIVPALRREPEGRPRAIVAHTIKGKGVSFMENNNEFHGKAPTKDEAERALRELA
ncbi:MAG: transketolase [Acidobacteriota bacterium]